LVRNIQGQGDWKITGDPEYKKLLDKVIKYKGYKNYIEQKRINDIGHHIMYNDAFSPLLKWKLVNAAGKLQLMHGVYGTSIACWNPENMQNCVFRTVSLGYSFLSQPIENLVIEGTHTIVDKIAIPSSIMVSKILPYNPKMVEVIGGEYTLKLSKGAAGAFTGLFDIIDIEVYPLTI